MSRIPGSPCSAIAEDPDRAIGLPHATVRIGAVKVGVDALGEGAVRRSDLLLAGAAPHAQDAIRVEIRDGPHGAKRTASLLVVSEHEAAKPAIDIRDNADRGRYELTVDGELAGISDYRDRGGRRIFVHTEVDPAFSGRGLGNRLAAGVLDDAASRSIRVVPRCPFIRAYIERHPEYRRLIGPQPPEGGPGAESGDKPGGEQPQSS